MPIVIPILLLGLGVGAVVMLALASSERPVPDHPPDSLPPPPPPGFPRTTGWKLVDKILPQLKAASDSSGIPLGLLVGWIAKESGGKIDEKPTKYGEISLFSLMPDEYKSLGFDDVERLRSDVTYAINAGLALIGRHMGNVNKLGIASKNSSYFWLLVKLCHTMGLGAAQKIVAMAQEAGASTRTWVQLETFALDHNSDILHATKHSPVKWFPFVDLVYSVGKPFGFGSMDDVVGAVPFPDIIDPLDALK